MFDIKNLNDDFFVAIDSQEVLDIKDLSTEEKVQCFRFFLTSDVITNASVIVNLYTLINGITGIDDEALQSKKVFFNSIVEYVDIKSELKQELDYFNIRLLEYYLGIIKGLDIVLDELKVHITNTYFNLMHLMTPILVSKLMNKYLDKIDVDNVKPTFYAIEFYNKINNSSDLMVEFVKSIIGEVKDSVNCQ